MRPARGHLRLTGAESLAVLRPGLKLCSLDLSGRGDLRELPSDMQVDHLVLADCPALTVLPSGLRCDVLILSRSRVRSLPADLLVRHRLELANCAALERLPEGLQVRRLNLNGCIRLAGLPRSLRSVEQLDVEGCVNLTELPEGLEITGWIEVAGSGLTSVPDLPPGGLRWRGVSMEPRSVFHPESITATEVLEEPNAERRRVLLERMGNERFFAQVDAVVLDTDRDAGGERRLLRVSIPRDEDLVCLAVCCPSTGRRYLLRVPPHVTTCRQAAAWTAGFEDPDEYHPLIET